MARRVAVIGGSAPAAQAALTLADMGVEVALLTPFEALGLDGPGDGSSDAPAGKRSRIWPLLLRAASHPLVTLYTNSEVRVITGKQGRFTVRATRKPRYVRADLCTGCGRCEDSCSVQVPLLLNGRKVAHSAIHAPVLDNKTVPSAFSIAKTGVPPCRAACPLGINVQGFVSLLSKGKVDEALSLIHEAAPLAGVLGRVCTHPCEESCKRAEVDDPVFIRALHRYAADAATGGIKYALKAPEKSRREKVAIVGSGPAGLAAGWELARRGYRPTIFESHAVVGGMLATGIPRFRLPWEVRFREVEAIKEMGVDIKTGITVGRDVTVMDLRERGYRAFFLAIGAHENNTLNIPGEELDGVVDSMALLFALNLKVGASVGSNVVVIGGGNSAVDSARTAKRRSKGTVRILYRRTAEEMTAVKEEVEEAINEGISIEYLTQPIEILGEEGKVAAIRCQRMKLGEVGADGRRRPEPIPGSEFVIEADHVVAAIGQRPNTSPFSIRWFEVDRATGNVRADPLTLETMTQGIFAGGDCVTGPNNVVDAIGAGLRAAESIDRYLRGRDLRRGRTLEKPTPVEVDVRERDAAYYRRARMPMIPYYKRRGNFEQTTLGLPDDAAERESQRCLNCALCSECLECERACELNAVFHNDETDQLEVGAGVVISFAPAKNGADSYLDFDAQGTPLQLPRAGIIKVALDEEREPESQLALASAVALEAAALLKSREEQPQAADTAGVAEGRAEPAPAEAEAAPKREPRVGVVLCRCGGSINSVVDFNQVTNELLQIPGVCNVREISQACSEEGAAMIAAQAEEWKLDRIVLAACRCCGLEQICFSCTDRRIMCQQHVSGKAALGNGRNVEFVNIREQCSWVHGDDPAGATRLAIDIISSGIARAKRAAPEAREERPVAGSVLVLGAGLSALAAARSLAAQSYAVTVVSGPASSGGDGRGPDYLDAEAALLKELEEQGTVVKPWPQAIGLAGSPGSYTAVLRHKPQASRVDAGAVIVELGDVGGQVPFETEAISRESLLGRILSRRCGANGAARGDSDALRGITIKETAGIFLLAPDADEPPEEQVLKGAAAAARASAYLHRGVVSPRISAVTIDSGLCRGCGDCSAICPYIEMRARADGSLCAYLDGALCLGCGACTARCPTGAIVQGAQTDENITATLAALLGKDLCRAERT